MNTYSRYFLTAALIITAIALMTIIIGTLFPASPLDTVNLTPVPTPTPTPALSDTETVRAGITNYFSSRGSYYQTLAFPAVDPLMQDVAMQNVRNGSHSLKLIGNTPAEALAVFKAYESDCGDNWTCYTPKDEFTVLNIMLYGGQYGIAVKQDGNQYDVCIAILQHHSSTLNTTSDGAHRLIEHPDTVEYVW